MLFNKSYQFIWRDGKPFSKNVSLNFIWFISVIIVVLIFLYKHGYYTFLSISISFDHFISL
jgi:hypothetical protein